MIDNQEADGLIQFVRYAVAGGAGTLFHFVFFNVLSWKVFPALKDNDPFVKLFKWEIVWIDHGTRARNAMINNIIMFFLSNLLVYYININWVFSSGRHSLFVEIAFFYLFAFAGMVVGTSAMGLLINKYKLQTTLAFGVNIIAAVLINYTARKFFVFSG